MVFYKAISCNICEQSLAGHKRGSRKPSKPIVKGIRIRRSIRIVFRFLHRLHIQLNHGLLALAMAWTFSGCSSKVNIPSVDHFYLVSTAQLGHIDVASHEKQLLNDLYILMIANEGEKVPLCTALKDSKQCVKDGVSVFVQGGMIPGGGKRKYYRFKDINLGDHHLEFTKDNSGTTFIGTPMYTRENKCQANVRNGGLQVEMTKYYATWAIVGNMHMAEGWAIDFIDLKKGIVGFQLSLDIKGFLTSGGGSKYALLKFPNIPETISESKSRYHFNE